MAGKAIRLFLVDGSPTGLITAEITNWTGHVLVAPRSRLQEALLRSEATKTGVYFLVGEDSGRSEVYVGEGDAICDRVKDHARDEDKQFWERVYFVTSKDFNLTKAHVRYLESRLVILIRTAGRAVCTNANVPAQSILPEADVSDMEFFLDQLGILLPAVGLDVLRAPSSTSRPNGSPAPSTHTDNDGSVSLRLFHPTVGVDAHGTEIDNEITVVKGSKGTGKKYRSNSYAALREQLITEGKVRLNADEGIEFLEDVVFRSPSAAAAVLNNCNSNGRTEWKLPDGRTLGAWWNDQLDSVG